MAPLNSSAKLLNTYAFMIDWLIDPIEIWLIFFCKLKCRDSITYGFLRYANRIHIKTELDFKRKLTISTETRFLCKHNSNNLDISRLSRFYVKFVYFIRKFAHFSKNCLLMLFVKIIFAHTCSHVNLKNIFLSNNCIFLAQTLAYFR